MEGWSLCVLAVVASAALFLSGMTSRHLFVALVSRFEFVEFVQLAFDQLVVLVLTSWVLVLEFVEFLVGPFGRLVFLVHLGPWRYLVQLGVPT